MEKDSNIRITSGARKTLRKIAKKEGRTLKVMFELVVNSYYEQTLDRA